MSRPWVCGVTTSLSESWPLGQGPSTNEKAENACRWEEGAKGEQWGLLSGVGPLSCLEASVSPECVPASLPASSQLLPGGPQMTHISVFSLASSSRFSFSIFKCHLGLSVLLRSHHLGGPLCAPPPPGPAPVWPLPVSALDPPSPAVTEGEM